MVKNKYRQIITQCFKKFEEILSEIKDIFAKFDNLIETNMNLAKFHFSAGNLSDALFRFKLVDFFSKDHFETNYEIARIKLLQNDQKSALLHLKRAIENLSQSDEKFKKGEELINLINEFLNVSKEIPKSRLKSVFLDIKYLNNEK